MQPLAFLFWVVFGALGSGLLVWISYRLNRDREVLGAGLVLLGGWYLAFGISAGHDLAVLLPQLVGGLFFAAFGIAGMMYSLLFLSAGWSLHAVWDMSSHLFSDVSYMPHWTAPACLGFDLLIGGYLLVRWSSARTGAARA